MGKSHELNFHMKVEISTKRVKITHNTVLTVGGEQFFQTPNIFFYVKGMSVEKEEELNLQLYLWREALSIWRPSRLPESQAAN